MTDLCSYVLEGFPLFSEGKQRMAAWRRERGQTTSEESQDIRHLWCYNRNYNICPSTDFVLHHIAP